MRMADATAQFRLIDLQLGGGLIALLASSRELGLSFEEISRRLYAEHGIEVSGQTLRNWNRKLMDEAEVA